MAYENLQQLLKRTKTTRLTLAELIGRNSTVITNLFKGERKLTADEAALFADYFKVDYAVILDKKPIPGDGGDGSRSGPGGLGGSQDSQSQTYGSPQEVTEYIPPGQPAPAPKPSLDTMKEKSLLWAEATALKSAIEGDVDAIKDLGWEIFKLMDERGSLDVTKQELSALLDQQIDKSQLKTK